MRCSDAPPNPLSLLVWLLYYPHCMILLNFEFYINKEVNLLFRKKTTMGPKDARNYILLLNVFLFSYLNFHLVCICSLNLIVERPKVSNINKSTFETGRMNHQQLLHLSKLSFMSASQMGLKNLQMINGPWLTGEARSIQNHQNARKNSLG